MRNKFLPYMTSDEIVDLVSYLERGTKMLEIGGGHSTIFLSRLVKKLVTIEHNLEWSKTIEKNMKNSNACNGQTEKTRQRIKSLSENVAQEVASAKLVKKYPNAKLIGKSKNNKSLVFEIQNKTLRVTPKGSIL
jgi:phospholipid N-methyltransferase